MTEPRPAGPDRRFIPGRTLVDSPEEAIENLRRAEAAAPAGPDLRAALKRTGWWPDLDDEDFEPLAQQLRAALEAAAPAGPDLRAALERLTLAGEALDAFATWSALNRPEVEPFRAELKRARAALDAS